jgi:hypothetical protein
VICDLAGLLKSRKLPTSNGPAFIGNPASEELEGEVSAPSLFPRKVALGQYFRHHLARDVGQAEIAALELEGQLGMVHA